MRLAGLIAAAALLAPAAAAAADQGGIVASTPAPGPLALAPGEVLLEIDSAGTVRSRADTVTLFASVKGRGGTAAAARSAAAAIVEKVKGAARAAGAAASEIAPGGGTWARIGFIGNEAPDVELRGPVVAEGATEAAMLSIRLRDSARGEAVRSAAEAAGANQVIGPLYGLEDESAARRGAKEDAIRRARAGAEDYARTLGLRVARILRVSERAGPNGSTENLERMFAAAYGFTAPPPGEVETTVRLAVDFALAPQR